MKVVLGLQVTTVYTQSNQTAWSLESKFWEKGYLNKELASDIWYEYNCNICKCGTYVKLVQSSYTKTSYFNSTHY